MKNASGGMAFPSPFPSPQAGFGIAGFIGTGGAVGERREKYVMPATVHEESTFKSKDIELERRSSESSRKEKTTIITKNCIFCGSEIPKQAKFCSKCGKVQ